MNFRKQFADRSPGFQLAPMADLIFNILFFFVVASIYAEWETKVGINVPTAESGEQKSRLPGELIINIDEKGVIYINSQPVTVAALRQMLAITASTFKGHPVIIRADRKTDYEAVVQVLDTCRAVDIWNVYFATLPPTPAGETPPGAAPAPPAPAPAPTPPSPTP